MNDNTPKTSGTSDTIELDDEIFEDIELEMFNLKTLLYFCVLLKIKQMFLKRNFKDKT